MTTRTEQGKKIRRGTDQPGSKQKKGRKPEELPGPITPGSQRVPRNELAVLQGADDQRLRNKVSNETFNAIGKSGVRNMAGHIASDLLKVAAVSTVALLAGGGLAAIILPAVAGKIALDIVAEWLVETGGETLKSWLIDWAKDTVFKPENKQADTERLARDLDRAMRRNGALADAVANLLEKLDALTEVVAELRDKAVERTRFIQRLRSELATARLENQRLREWTEQLERELAKGAAHEAAASSPASFTPAGSPVVQQPPTGPPAEDDQRLLKDLLGTD